MILTRFNIASPGREAPIRNKPGWLERRFELFERFCLPSVAGQSSLAFDWLILFDIDTPVEFKQRVKDAQSIFPFHARFLPPVTLATIVEDLKAISPPRSERLLTTRLDNDDAIASDFVERIQKEAGSREDGTVLNFTRGLALSRGKLYSAIDTSNPFTSLVESYGNDVKTIWSAQHQDLGRKWRLVQVSGDPAWLQVVHGENVTNRIRGRRLHKSSLTDRFRLAGKMDLAPTSKIGIALENAVLVPLRAAREALFKALKPLHKLFIKR